MKKQLLTFCLFALCALNGITQTTEWSATTNYAYQQKVTRTVNGIQYTFSAEQGLNQYYNPDPTIGKYPWSVCYNGNPQPYLSGFLYNSDVKVTFTPSGSAITYIFISQQKTSNFLNNWDWTVFYDGKTNQPYLSGGYRYMQGTYVTQLIGKDTYTFYSDKDNQDKLNTYQWEIVNNGTIIPFVSGGYKYTAGTKVTYKPVESTITDPYIFECTQDNQSDPKNATSAWSVYYDGVTALPILSAYRYAFSGTLATWGNNTYVSRGDSYPQQIINNKPNTNAWTVTAINSQLWILPKGKISPTDDNPIDDISRYGKVILKPNNAYGNQLTLSNKGIDMLYDNSPSVLGNKNTALHADGNGLELSQGYNEGASSSAKISNDGTINLQTANTKMALTIGYETDSRVYYNNMFTVSSDGNVVSNSETTNSMTIGTPANPAISVPATGTLTVNGNVGIQTTNPMSTLQIGEDDNSSLHDNVPNGVVITANSKNSKSEKAVLELHSKAASNKLDIEATNWGSFIGNIPNSTGTMVPLYIQEQGGSVVIGNLSKDHLHVCNLDISGNIGIGKPAIASYRLAVDGGIVASSLDIKDPVPNSDYVFEKDYKLRTLAETEAYVAKNKHLPEVPSAQEFKKGYSVGTMDDILLRKVEELTLYMIELQKQNEAIQKQNAALKAKVEKLEKKIR